MSLHSRSLRERYDAIDTILRGPLGELTDADILAIMAVWEPGRFGFDEVLAAGRFAAALPDERDPTRRGPRAYLVAALDGRLERSKFAYWSCDSGSLAEYLTGFHGAEATEWAALFERGITSEARAYRIIRETAARHSEALVRTLKTWSWETGVYVVQALSDVDSPLVATTFRQVRDGLDDGRRRYLPEIDDWIARFRSPSQSGEPIILGSSVGS